MTYAAAALLTVGFLTSGVGCLAHAQTYHEKYKACEATSQTPAERVWACDAVLAAAEPDAKADQAMILLYRSDANLSAGQFDAAIRDADKASELLTRFQPAQNARCWVRAVANKEIDLARGACDTALDISKTEPGVWDSSGLVGLREGKWEKAWSDYNHAFEMDGRMIGSLYGRGLAALALGRVEESDADLRQAASAAAEFKSYGLNPETVRAQAKKPG